MKILEGFGNVFDSSTIDYAEKFEKKDQKYFKQRIDIWMTLFTASDKGDYYKSKSLLDYTINDDLTIDLHNSIILFDTAYACFQYKLSKARNWMSTIEYNYPEYVLEFLCKLLVKHNYTEYNFEIMKNKQVLSYIKASEVLMHILRYLRYDNMDDEDTTYESEINMIPSWIKFSKCESSFIVRSTTNLSSLKGVPKRINGDLIIDNLSTLTYKNNHAAFEDGPEYVGGRLSAMKIGLTSEDLQGFPEVGGSIYLNNNNLSSLNGLPEIINSDLYVSYNNLPSLKGTVKYVKGYINAVGQKPDYGKIRMQYFEENPNASDLSDDVLSKMMGPRGIRYFGKGLAFGYKPETDGYWKFKADWSNCSDPNHGMPTPILIEGPEKSAMLQGIRWWDPKTKSGKEMRGIKEFPKVNEGFSNLFDSSTVDYATHFEEKDRRELIKDDIKRWVEVFIYNNSRERNVNYKINDDLSIDLLDNTDNNMSPFEYFCIRPFEYFKLQFPEYDNDGKIKYDNNQKAKYHWITYKDLTDNFGNPLPLDRLPDFINIRSVNGKSFSCQDCNFTTLKGCPTENIENYSCERNNLTNFDYLPKSVVTFDARNQLGKKLYNEKYIDFSNVINSLNNGTLKIDNFDEAIFSLWIPEKPGSMEGYEIYLHPYKKLNGKYSLGSRTSRRNIPGDSEEWNCIDIGELIYRRYGAKKYKEFNDKLQK